MAINLNEVLNQPLNKRGPALDDWFNRRFDELFDKKMAERDANKVTSLAIMATKGTLDWAYPTFIISSTAAALGWNVTVFFTFYGLNLLKKDLHLEISGLGNPAMPMKMPFGPTWFRDIEWKMPNLIMAGVPGFEKVATGLMKETVKQKGVAPVSELRELCVEADVKLIGCQMTQDLFGWEKSDFMPEISEWAGAATYLSIASSSDVNLFI
jgi:peroxiredoxin family protein